MADIKLPARSLHIYYREENNLFGRIGQRGGRGSQSRSSSVQSGGETRAGSNPAFGTMVETKGIPAKPGVPFFIHKSPVGKFLGSLE